MVRTDVAPRQSLAQSIRAALPVTPSVGALFVVLIAAMLALWMAALQPAIETDLFWQIPEGLQILHGHLPTTIPYAIEAGQWVDHEWLFEAMVAWLWLHGTFSGFVLIAAAAYALFPAFGYLMLRKLGYCGTAASVVALLAAAGEKVGYALRAQTFCYYLFTLEVWLLASGLQRPWLLLPIAIVWANLHASAALSPILCLLFLIGCTVQGQKAAGLRALAGLGFALLGTLCSPNGIHLWSYATTKLAPANQAIAAIQEWRALTAADGYTWIVVAPIVLALTFTLARFRRERTFEILLTVVFLVFAIKQMRQVAFLVPAASLLLAGRLDGAFAVRWIESRRYRLSALLLLPFAAAAAFAGLSITTVSATPAGPWREAAAIVRARAIHGNVFATYDWAAYLRFQNAPVRLLLDGHGDPYAPGVWRDYLTIWRVQPGWLETLRRRQFQAVVVEATAPLATALATAPGWRLAESRGTVRAFIRSRSRDDHHASGGETARNSSHQSKAARAPAASIARPFVTGAAMVAARVARGP